MMIRVIFQYFHLLYLSEGDGRCGLILSICKGVRIEVVIIVGLGQGGFRIGLWGGEGGSSQRLLSE